MNARAESGFTLTELMLAVAVVAILAGIAVPNFQSLIQSQQVKSASFDLFSSFSVARSEAIKRNGNVTVTPTSTTDWGQGWTISSAGGESIKVQAALKGVVISSGPASVVYTLNGRATAASSFQVDSSATATANARCLRIGLNGMPYTVMGACS